MASPLAWNGDLSTGDQSQWNGYSDADSSGLAYLSGRIHSETHHGYKFSSGVIAQGWTGHYPLNDTSGTTAVDVLNAAQNGTYTGGFTLNQTGVNNWIAEAGAASVLLNGSTGFINLGANGYDFSSGSWGFFAFVKPTALGNAHRGLFGGPTGSYCASLFADASGNGGINVGIVGGASILIPGFSRQATLNQWNAVGISYNASTDVLTRFIDSDSINYGNVKYTNPNTLVPTAGVKVNQIGKRDTGGFYQGYMQGVLFMDGQELTEMMFLCLQDEFRLRATNKGTIVVPEGTHSKGLTRVNATAAKTNPAPPYPYDVAERYHDVNLSYLTGISQFYYMSWRFPSDSNWAGTFFTPVTSPGEGWCFLNQVAFVNLTASSLEFMVCPPGAFGAASTTLLARFAGGPTVAGQAPQDINYVNKAAGNGWNTHYPPQSAVSETNKRFPVILGPNTFLGVAAPFTYDVLHEFILEIKWSTTASNGFARIWHREKNSGPTWQKVYEMGTGAVGSAIGPGRNNLQSGSSGSNSGGTDKFGLYLGRGTAPLEVFQGPIGCASTFAEAEAFFASESVTAINIDQRAYRWRNDDGNQTTATWKAAQNVDISQLVSQNVRLRFQAQETAGIVGSSGAPQLQVNKNGIGWTNVTDISSVARASDSGFVADGAQTTQQLTGGTGQFLAGTFDDVNGLTGAVNFTITPIPKSYTEMEYCIQIVSADVQDGDSLQFRLTFPGDSSPVYTQIPTITVIGVPLPPPTDAYRDLILARSGLRVYYRMSDVTTTLVDSKSGVNGTYKGGYTQGVPGIPSSSDLATEFNGTTGYAEVPDDPLLDLGNGPFSLGAWIKRNSNGTLDVKLDKGAGAYTIYIATDNTVRFGVSGGVDICTSSITLTDTTAIHRVLVTYNGGANVVMYIDGIDRTGTKVTATLVDNSQPLRIGVR